MSSGELESTRSRFHVGTGAFYLSQLENFQFQIGGRVGLRRESYSDDAGPPTNVDYAIGPAAGGEYYVGDPLSLGLEARLLYTNLDQEREDASRSNSIVNTEAAAYLRIHF